jgi:hypothetical protein
LEIIRGKFRQARERPDDAGVEVVVIDLPEGAHCSVKIALDIILVGNVGLLGDGGRADPIGHLAGLVTVDVNHDDLRTFGRQPFGGRTAQPVACSGNDNDRIVESSGHQ